MAALVQVYPPQTETLTMLQARPNSATGRMPSGQQQPSFQYVGAASPAPRSNFYGNASTSSYRGMSTPVQQYAFTSTPNLNSWQQDMNMNQRGRQSSTPSPVMGNFAMGVAQSGSRDDSSIVLGRSAAMPARQSPTQATYAQRAAPDRYRRAPAQPTNHARSQSVTLPSTLNAQNPTQAYAGGNNARAALANRPHSFYGVPGTSMDDMHIPQGSPSEAKGLRKRNTNNLDATDAQKQLQRPSDKDIKGSRGNSTTSVHSRNGSSESVNSSRSAHSRPSSANRNKSVSTNPSPSPTNESSPSTKQEQPKLVNIPARGSSSDASKRTLNPSPLSKPVTMAGDSADTPSSPAGAGAASGNLDSPAAKQLAAINQKGGKAKGKTSRLRRAFSFGSAAELRKAAEGAGEEEPGAKLEASKLRKEPNEQEAYDAEQARIAEAQEAGGIGNSIYGRRMFSGSTDNLSISSTASSASIMIRKMGRGMKKSGRSLAGLFRPKSVIGVPAAEPLAPEASQAEVSMVTVEAETQRVNVTAEPQTADTFPHLERNSIDASQVEAAAAATERTTTISTDSRKSIVGGDSERAEVLAAVRKGILKRKSNCMLRVWP
jgi:hypothetical protein